MSDVFITDNFLLQGDTAAELFHNYAKDMPIIDYHCHLIPGQVASDYRFKNLTDIWLAGDHYKWRAMRSNGVAERFCTGDASDYEKFEKYAETVPMCLRNPLYHWTHLELKRPFGISDRLLGPATAKSVWDDCNAKLATPGFSARGIMKQMNVVLVCTTDDPISTLPDHAAVAADKSFKVQMLPTFRPDKGMAVENPAAFNAWVDQLVAVSGIDVPDFDAYLTAIKQRHDFFHAMGCRLSDHGVETIDAEEYTIGEIKSIYKKVRGGAALEAIEIAKFRSAMMHEFALLDHARGWTQQIHIGPIRNNNTRLFRQLGPDTGFDSIGDAPIAKAMSRFLDRLDQTNQLARTILYNINPRDNEIYATMLGNFQDGSIAGKIQFGSGWWFLDQRDGMLRQLEASRSSGCSAASSAC